MAVSLPNLSAIFSKALGSLSRKSAASIAGVDIGSSSIKIVQAKIERGAAVLETYGEIALGPYAGAEVGQSVNPPPEKIGEALADLVREANVSTLSGGFCVPLSGSLIHVISLPTKNRTELASMVPIEARKYIPVPISEVTLDWFVIPDEEAQFLGPRNAERNPNMTDALMVAIQNQTLTKLQTAATAGKMQPLFFEVEPFSMARASYQHGTAPTMVIDFGASSTRIYVVKFGIIDVSHTVNRGGQDITLALAKAGGLSFAEAETKKRETGLGQGDAGSIVLDTIFSEARRIFLSYERKEGKAISEVVLVGGGAALKGLEAALKRSIEAKITVAAPFDKMSAPAFISDVLKSAGPSFANAVGLALRGLQE